MNVVDSVVSSADTCRTRRHKRCQCWSLCVVLV